MNFEFLHIEKQYIFISLGLALAATMLLPYAWIGIIIGLILLISFAVDDKYILPILIVAYLVITSDISEELRIFINIAGYLILVYMFIKEYGLKFTIYKNVPFLIQNLILYTIFSLVISTIFSSKPLISIVEILRTSAFLIMMYIFYSFIRTVKDVKLYLYFLLAAGIILGTVIIYFFFSVGNEITIFELQGLVHEGGFYHNVAAAGGIFAITISINLALLFYEKFKELKIKTFLTVTLIIQVTALLLTNSRAAFLAVFFSSIFIITKLNWKLFKKLFYSVAGFSVLIIAIFPRIIDIIGIFIRAGRVLQNTRYYLWDIAFGIIKDHFLFGCGPGMFKYYMYKYMPVMFGSWTASQIKWVYTEAGTGQAHNFFLYRFSETGFLGFIAAIALIVIFFYLCAKVLAAVRGNKYWYIVMISITGSGIGLVARSFFESTGLFTNGWITRDLPFWILFIVVIFFYENLVVLKNKLIEL